MELVHSFCYTVLLLKKYSHPLLNYLKRPGSCWTISTWRLFHSLRIWKQKCCKPLILDQTVRQSRSSCEETAGIPERVPKYTESHDLALFQTSSKNFMLIQALSESVFAAFQIICSIEGASQIALYFPKMSNYSFNVLLQPYQTTRFLAWAYN